MSDLTHAPQPCQCCDELPKVTEERNRIIDAYRGLKTEQTRLVAQAVQEATAGLRAERDDLERRRIAYANQVALATEATRKEHAEALASHMQEVQIQTTALRAALKTCRLLATTWGDSPDPWLSIKAIEQCAGEALENA